MFAEHICPARSTVHLRDCTCQPMNCGTYFQDIQGRVPWQRTRGRTQTNHALPQCRPQTCQRLILSQRFFSFRISPSITPLFAVRGVYQRNLRKPCFSEGNSLCPTRRGETRQAIQLISTDVRTDFRDRLRILNPIQEASNSEGSCRAFSDRIQGASAQESHTFKGRRTLRENEATKSLTLGSRGGIAQAMLSSQLSCRSAQYTRNVSGTPCLQAPIQIDFPTSSGHRRFMRSALCCSA